MAFIGFLFLVAICLYVTATTIIGFYGAMIFEATKSAWVFLVVGGFLSAVLWWYTLSHAPFSVTLL